MMTTKKFNAGMAKAAKENKRNTIIAAGTAGITSVIASAAVYLINNHKNNKLNGEIDNLRNDVNTIYTAVTVTENVLAATTKAAVADDDVKDNIKYVPINIYEFMGCINNNKNIYTKSGPADSVNFTAMTNPTTNSYNFSTKYYMTEKDYAEIFKAKAEEKTEEKTDDKK